MDQAGKGQDREDRRSNSGIAREPATGLRGGGPRRVQGARLEGASGRQHSRGQQWLPTGASVIRRAQDGGAAKRVGRSTDFMCQEHSL